MNIFHGFLKVLSVNCPSQKLRSGTGDLIISIFGFAVAKLNKFVRAAQKFRILPRQGKYGQSLRDESKNVLGRVFNARFLKFLVL